MNKQTTNKHCTSHTQWHTSGHFQSVIHRFHRHPSQNFSFYACLHTFLLAPPRKIAPRHYPLCTPHITQSENAFQALVDPPSHGNHLSFDGGDEQYDESPELAVQQNLLGMMNVLSSIVKQFTTAKNNYEQFLWELNGKLVAITEGETMAYDDDRECLHMIACKLDSIITDQTETWHTDQTCLLMIESKLDHLLQHLDMTKCINDDLLGVCHAVHEENAQ
jgi:hypothetical protein